MVVAQSKRYTPAEYLEREEQAETKSELIQGEKIIEMAGASANHNRLSVNFCRLFPLDNGDRQYDVFMFNGSCLFEFLGCSMIRIVSFIGRL